jgi:signal transduction histidine kinase
MVIDDDQKFSFGLVAILRRAGYQVVTAKNGEEGLQAIKGSLPDLILCDIMMPPPNGIQLKKELTKDPKTGRIPFLFLTARTAQVDKLAGLESGADDYITKPFDVYELLARIQSVLRRDDLGHQRGVEETTDSVDKLRKSISTNLSHEMRTPLTVLLSTLDLVIREKFTTDNDELFRYVNRANTSANRLKFLIEDLEMLHDIDCGNLTTFNQLIDIKFHIKDPIDQILKIWEAKNLKVHMVINPEINVYAPRKEFSHVVTHLVDNACKFSPVDGHIHISIQPYGVGGCVVDIIDQGNGIPLELRERVFERYYQISQGDAREFGGLGIGLTLARAFAESQGGDVQIMDNPTGCRVRMVIPPQKFE